ncbi:GTPase HflX [Calditrichota bacterium]
MTAKNRQNKPEREPSIIIALQRKGVPFWEVEDNLDELEQLIDTAGGVCLKRIVQDLATPNASTYIGKGKVEEVARLVSDMKIKLVVFDDDLTPAQVRNLEKKIDAKILDRSGVILDIFINRARTREARIQVETAQLQYLLPRLTRRWQHLSRQVGGIGTRRGPGETQLEVDRRVIGKRLSQLRVELKKIEKARATRRKKRSDIFKVAIIGYTNAGKSTLLNALTKAGVFVEDRLFATLDSTVRAFRLPTQRKVLLIDTIGFIRKLPVDLVASFRSTLEESRQADLFLHVVDVSHPHWEEQLARTEEIMKDLELEKTPQVLIFNKVDRMEDPVLLDGLKRQYPESLFISALRKIRLYEIPERIEQFAAVRWERGTRVFRPDEIERIETFEKTVTVLGRTFKDGMIYVDFMIMVRDGGDKVVSDANQTVDADSSGLSSEY